MKQVVLIADLMKALKSDRCISKLVYPTYVGP